MRIWYGSRADIFVSAPFDIMIVRIVFVSFLTTRLLTFHT